MMVTGKVGKVEMRESICEELGLRSHNRLRCPVIEMSALESAIEGHNGHFPEGTLSARKGGPGGSKNLSDRLPSERGCTEKSLIVLRPFGATFPTVVV
jgi:hypothetical protein